MIKRMITLPLFLFSLIFAQGTYYNGIDPNSSDFITKLSAKLIVRSTNNYTAFKDFALASEKRPDGKVHCVYSDLDVTTTFNREHTYCSSWMAANLSHENEENSFEYSDYHNLLPTQIDANAKRGNYPFGNVVSGVDYELGGSKRGKDSSGKTVFEPRDQHKGDAARILLYMSVCYNGYQNSNWSFGSITAGQNADVLLSWHQQDPPDAWEKAINEAVFTKQGNRNPFVDYPEWTNYINFNNLSYIAPTAGTANPAAFSASALSETQINLNWQKNSDGNNTLIAFNTVNSFGTPQTGTVYTAGQTISGGGSVIYTGGSTTFIHSSLSAATNYFYKIWSVNSSNIYSSGLIQNALTQGGGGSGQLASDLIISEYVEGSSSNKAIEIFNGTGLPVNLSGYSIRKQNNGEGNFNDPVIVNRTLQHNQTFIMANAAATFAADTLIAYATNPTLSFNGNDAVGLYKGETMIDIVGVANSATNWGLDMTLVRNSNITSPSTTYNPADWTQIAKDTFTGLGNHTMDFPSSIGQNYTVAKPNINAANYPNPFNPSTSIIFNVKNSQQVQLKIYNVSGRQVLTHSQNCTAGQNSIKWDARDLPAGIYLYSISADGILMNGKMSLIK